MSKSLSPSGAGRDERQCERWQAGSDVGFGIIAAGTPHEAYSYILQAFFDAKSDEIVNIFKPAFTDERKRVYNIVTEANPANNSKYSALIQEKTN